MCFKVYFCRKRIPVFQSCFFNLKVYCYRLDTQIHHYLIILSWLYQYDLLDYIMSFRCSNDFVITFCQGWKST